jgi:hypothetical protein
MTYVFASMTPRTATFTLVFSRDGHVSGFFLHVHERQPSVLWVVGSGSSVTLVFLHVHELLRSALRLRASRGWGLNHKLTSRTVYVKYKHI